MTRISIILSIFMAFIISYIFIGTYMYLIYVYLNNWRIGLDCFLKSLCVPSVSLKTFKF